MYTVLHAAASSGNHEVMQQVLSALGSKAQAKLRYLGQRGAGGSTCHTPLHLAAAGGNYTMVQMLLAAGADVGRRDSQGSMPLHRAAAAGHLEVVRALVAAGADLDSQDAGKATPLHLAAAGGHTEVARVLVAAGAGLDSQGAHSDTPLHLAAEGGHTEVTQVLVAAGAGLDRQGRYKATPLHLAAAWGHKEVAQALVAAGADRDLQDAFGDMPLHKALAAHRHQLVPLLVTPSNVNHAVRGDAALHIAATAAAKGVALLLAAGACLTDRNDKGLTALAVAAGDGCTAALHVLLQHHLQQHSSRSQLLAVLQEAADQALSRGGRRQWSLLATTAMGVLGEEGLHSLWRTYKQRATDTEHPHFAVSIRPSCTLEAWIELWTSGCSELATQRSRITGRLQQLVMNPQQQQQQAQPEQQLEAASPAGFLQAGNSARAVCGFGTESAPDPLLAPNAAEDGSEEQVQAAAKLAGLSAAAVAAVEGGDWGLTMRLLRQLEAEDATKAKQAVRAVHAAVSKQQLLLLLQQQQQQQQQQQLQAEAGAAAEVEEDDSSDDAWRKEQEEENRRHTADLTAAVQVADALLPDWLGTQRQRPQELRDAVLAAVERVGAAACF
jgi:ankyrin repeat protein